MCNPAQNACWYGAGGMSTAEKGDGGAYFFKWLLKMQFGTFHEVFTYEN